jgi:hypothetical protein
VGIEGKLLGVKKCLKACYLQVRAILSLKHNSL